MISAKATLASCLTSTLSGAFLLGCAGAPGAPVTPIPAPAAGAVGGPLSIQVTGLAVGKGYLNFEVVDSEQAWKASGNPVVAVRARVTAEKMRFDLHDVPPGKVAIRLFQDEDGDGKMNRNLVGVPTEGYGFSGKPSMMGPPSFDDAAITRAATGTTVVLQVR